MLCYYKCEYIEYNYRRTDTMINTFKDFRMKLRANSIFQNTLFIFAIISFLYFSRFFFFDNNLVLEAIAKSIDKIMGGMSIIYFSLSLIVLIVLFPNSNAGVFRKLLTFVLLFPSLFMLSFIFIVLISYAF